MLRSPVAIGVQFFIPGVGAECFTGVWAYYTLLTQVIEEHEMRTMRERDRDERGERDEWFKVKEKYTKISNWRSVSFV